MNKIDPSGMQAHPVHLLTDEQKQIYADAVVEADAIMAQQDASGLVDFVPILGDIKGIAEAIADPSLVNIAAAGVGLVPGAGDLAGKAMKGADDVAESFFDGAKYSDKVEAQMGQGDFHGFPESVTAFEGNGTVSSITGGDGVSRDMLQIPGGYKGREGNFTFIKEPDGTINHRMFEPEE